MRPFVLVAVASIVCCAVACVGDDAGNSTSDSGVFDGGTDAAAVTDAAADTDAAALTDAAADTDAAAITDAAAVTDAGPVSSFLCGEGRSRISCNLGDFCCLAADGKPTCSATACGPGLSGVKPACATSADCPGKVCCGENDGVTFLSFSCKDRAACINTGGRVACQLDRDDCARGTACLLPAGDGYGFGICQ